MYNVVLVTVCMEFAFSEVSAYFRRNLSFESLATLRGSLFHTHTRAIHKMSFAEALAPVFTAADLLGLDESQLVSYLENNRCVGGGFDISNAAGVERLTKSQRYELGSRLR